LGFFCPERQCWRGSGPCAGERHPAAGTIFGVTFLSFLSLFSVLPVSVHQRESSIGAVSAHASCNFELVERK